ncbi:MAG: trigger factor [Eubacteriales bacterium]|nr:trigger factor [Eubacteriales bacterium]
MMRKYWKLALCGLMAAALAAGCSKKDETADTTAAAESGSETTAAGESAAEEIDLGTLTKLGTYKGVEVTKESTEVTDEELESRIQSILQANPEYVEVDRPAREGDTVNIDYVGMKDGVAFDGGTAEGYPLELGSGQFIDGFEDGLIGAEKGSELSLNLTFPENYSNADLAGQAVVFDVTVNSVEEKKDAVLDDNFVQRISDFNTVDEFRADTKADMEAENETAAEQKLEYDAFMAAINSSEFDLNEEAVEEQYNSQYNYYSSMVQMYGMTMESYTSMIGMTEEEFEGQLRESAEAAIKQQLLTEKIAEAENFEVDDTDRQVVADEYGMDIQTMKDTYGEEALDNAALMYKVQNFIVDNAVVKY